jgi:hypothetical protein
MLPRPFQMTKMTEEQRRALRILARHLDGCAEAALLAEGFSVSQLAVLVLEGLGRGEARRDRQSPQGLDADYRGRPQGDRTIGLTKDES